MKPFASDDESALAQEAKAILDYRIRMIESTIQRGRNIPDERRAELLTMVAGLKSEIKSLAETHHEEALSITRFADASTHEVSRAQKNPQLAETALHGLRLSIQGFEDSHPVLVGMVGRFATMLSNMGI